MNKPNNPKCNTCSVTHNILRCFNCKYKTKEWQSKNIRPIIMRGEKDLYKPKGESEGQIMSDIELVIKIDEELYNHMQTEEYDKHLDKRFDYRIRFAVKDGTPLPKGHGRLIDADDLDITTITTDDYSGNEVIDVVLKENVDDTPTIIEADKEL